MVDEFFSAWALLIPGLMLVLAFVCRLVGHFYQPALDLVNTYPRLSALADGVVSGVLAWYWTHRRHVYTSYDGQRYVLDSNRKPVWIDDPQNK